MVENSHGVVMVGSKKKITVVLEIGDRIDRELDATATKRGTTKAKVIESILTYFYRDV